MSHDAILTIDQGTTNTKALLLDRQGQIVAIGHSPLQISHPQSGWVEQSADDIWQSVVIAIEQCLAHADEVTIVGIGISNQRESIVIWDSQSGRPLAPAITWQCRRTAVLTEALKTQGHQQQVIAKTGLPLDPLFPSTKIHWLQNLTSGGHRRIGTVDSWLIWKLTGGQTFATDRSNASRTQLLNIQTGTWDPQLCDLFDVDINMLPQVHDSKHRFGHTRSVPGVPDGIPVASAIGDSHAALFGHAAFKPGEAKATFGTGSSVMMVTDGFTIPQDGMTTTIAWSVDGDITYALEGNILVSASLFPWTATLLGLEGDVDKLMELAASVDDSNGVMLVPALVGLGAPHWSPGARGVITGMGFTSTPAHIAHAAALSMPLQVVDVFSAMHNQTAVSNGRIFVDGGPSRNIPLMQSLAGLLAQPVTICQDPELSALGAGMLAGLETGFWSDLTEIAALQRKRTIVEPAMPEQKRLDILTAWSDAISKCLHTGTNDPHRAT